MITGVTKSVSSQLGVSSFLIAGTSCLIPLDFPEVEPLLLPDDHLALLSLLPNGALLALGVLKLQCELVEGARNNLNYGV